MAEHYDFAVIGQGVAGTLIHFLLSQENLKGLVIDKGHDHAASKVASGLINPITGRKYVKSWMFDDLRSEVVNLYSQLEEYLDIKIVNDHDIVRVLSSIKEENLWYTKSTIEGYEKYFKQDVDSSSYQSSMKDAFSYGEVSRGLKVDLHTLISAYRQHLAKSQLLQESGFMYENLKPLENGSWTYGELTFDKIIFCEGWQLRFNPFFKQLGQEAAKGEVLIIKIKGASISQSIKKKIFITPLKDDLYWVGSTYQWEFGDNKPTTEKREYLVKALDDMINVEYEIVDHWAGVRPTTLDRRPLLGEHPDLNNMFVFNGLGTKGASLAPYWALKMKELLLHRTPISDDVNISRFS